MKNVSILMFLFALGFVIASLTFYFGATNKISDINDRLDAVEVSYVDGLNEVNEHISVLDSINLRRDTVDAVLQQNDQNIIGAVLRLADSTGVQLVQQKQPNNDQ